MQTSVVFDHPFYVCAPEIINNFFKIQIRVHIIHLVQCFQWRCLITHQKRVFFVLFFGGFFCTALTLHHGYCIFLDATVITGLCWVVKSFPIHIKRRLVETWVTGAGAEWRLTVVP